MCGIVFTAIHQHQNHAALNRLSGLRQDLEHAGKARGPDTQKRLEVILDDTRLNAERSTNQLALSFFASELLLRGDSMVTQPHYDEVSRNLLCWNGEVCVFEGLDIMPDENDGSKLFSCLQSCNDGWDMRDLLGGVEGPYAFVYYQKPSLCLYFARDPLGRRSLLIHKPTPENPYIILGSVSVGPNTGYLFEELSTDFIFCLDLSRLLHSDMAVDFESCLIRIPRHSGRQEVMRLPFAYLSKVNPAVPKGDPVPLEKLTDDIPEFLVKSMEGFISLLDRSVMLQVRDIARLKKSPGQASIGVLFSGGIDSTVLAFLAHRHVPLGEPIDLLNVAFENPRKIQVKSDGQKKKVKETLPDRVVSYLVPDRVTGLMEVDELRRLCPGRLWNFVEVDVPYEVSKAARPLIEEIMFPGRTVMDLSLAMALYFAAKGEGTVRRIPDVPPEPYTSSARILLSGLGSDELLGGYGRYRTAYIASGWKAVIEELQLDLDRIPTRNLGRDDRVISSHGKETRHPFLSISFVNFVSELPVHFKVDPRLEVGLGDKLLLRLAARKLGLLEVSRRKKRAMQFGSHSARMQPGEANRHGDLALP